MNAVPSSIIIVKDKVAEQLSVVFSETAKLTKTLGEYRERINSKDEEIISLRHRIDHELSLSEEQLRVIRDDLRHEILASDEYQRNLLDVERLHSQIAEYERKREQNEEAEKERIRIIEELRLDNEKLKEVVKNIDKADQNKELDSLRKTLAEKDEELRSLREDAARLKEENEKLNKKSELTNYADKMLREEMSTLRSDSNEKTSQIEALHIRVKELLHQMCNIKEELEKKNEGVQQIGDSTQIKLEASSSMTEEKLKNLNMEFEKNIERLKKRELELTKQLRELRETGHDCNTSNEEVEKLKKEIRKMDELMNQMKDDLKEKQKLLADKELRLLNKKEEINSREEALKESAVKHCEEFMAIQDRIAATKVNKAVYEKPDTTCSEIQTDPIRSQPPVSVANLVKVDELKSRIVELEQALEIKNDLIEKLHEQMPQTSREDMVKRKDRSQSMTTGGVFQNFVSQMKDKRDEANEQRTKKKEEKRAEKVVKEAAIEITKEKSPLRSKSPSLLTRFRDRSPNKTHTPVDNLETTPSMSSR
uniref:Trichohyalin-like n=1 Tax=Angiostrongylus cantonensis TaxID=6313 RepID=A0A0K0DQF8_ANGCA